MDKMTLRVIGDCLLPTVYGLDEAERVMGISQLGDVLRNNLSSVNVDLVGYMPPNVRGYCRSSLTYFHLAAIGGFRVITEYEIKTITTEIVNAIIDYTQGQWSDGWGEEFEQQEIDLPDNEYTYVSPWHGDQKIKCEVHFE